MYNQWNAALVRVLAHVEAFIDFGEDENIEDGILDGSCTAVWQCSLIKSLLSMISGHSCSGSTQK